MSFLTCSPILLDPDFTQSWIAYKADCTQERHLFISMKHSNLPPL